MDDKTEAMGQMQRAIRAIESALQILDSLYPQQLATDQEEMFAVMTGLNERLQAAKLFLRHIEASEVEVRPPDASSYTALDNALADLYSIDQSTAGLRRILQVTAAVGDAVSGTRAEVSKRTV